MGPHMVALVKLKLITESRGLNPLAASLLWTFVLKLGCSFKLVRRAYMDMAYASRLFFFQLGRIVLEAGEPAPAGTSSRFQRAIRLVCRRVVHAQRSPSQQLSDEESLQALSMLAL